MKQMKSNKGITLIALSITIVIMLILAFTIATNVDPYIERKEFTNLENDMIKLKQEIDYYYSKYKQLPICNKYIGLSITSRSVNDNGNYYVIDLDLLRDLDLNYGLDFDGLPNKTDPINYADNLNDIYIINEQSHVIYFPDGIYYDGKTYYTTLSASDYIGEIGAIYRVFDLKRMGTVVDENYTVADDDGNRFVVPKGYKIAADSATTISGGIVIEDSHVSETGNGRGNQWVWIPVEYPVDMYERLSSYSYLNGSLSYTYLYSKSQDIGTTFTRIYPGSSSYRYREPDLASQRDIIETNYSSAGFTSAEEMSETLASDYEKMINSIIEYKGFYVGRYEIGGTVNSPLVKQGPVINNTNWYELYKACKNISKSDAVETNMIWGICWDKVCYFAKYYGDKVNVKNLIEVGNFANSSGSAYTNSGSSNFDDTTGRSEYWKINNIYDFAGNCKEWTQEAYYNAYRALRGGDYTTSQSGNTGMLGYISYEYPTSTNRTLSSRPILYIPVVNI